MFTYGQTALALQLLHLSEHGREEGRLARSNRSHDSYELPSWNRHADAVAVRHRRLGALRERGKK